MHNNDEDISILLLAADLFHELFRFTLVSVAVIGMFGIAVAFGS